MSWDFYTNKKQKARKEYACDWKDHLELSDIIGLDRDTKAYVVDIDQCKEFGFTDEDIAIVQAYIDCGFKIAKGELHNVTSGKADGDFMTFRGKISISNIVQKYDLNEE